MYKAYQDTAKSALYKGFPALVHQMNNEAYGFSGCSFWLDAAQGLNTQTNLGAISQWVERIKKGKFEQTTAGNRPRLITSDINFNNLPVVEFNAQQRYLDAAVEFGGMLVSPRKTFLLVFQKTSNASGTNHRTVLIGEPGGANAGQSFNMEASSGNNVGFFSGLSAQSISATPYNTNPHIIAVNVNGFVDNGVSVTVTGTTFEDAVYSRISGSLGTTSGTFKLAKVVCWEQLLSQTDLVQLCGNVNTKYAIY